MFNTTVKQMMSEMQMISVVLALLSIVNTGKGLLVDSVFY